MKRILVTGGDGTLGRSMVKRLVDMGHVVRVMSRKPAPDNLSDSVEWAQADVTTGEGVKAALDDVHTIVNCMSNPQENTYETDIVGLRNFLAKAKVSGISYLVHISIIGIDRIVLRYYQYKLGSEIVVMESGIPHMICRIAQFYTFVDYLISPLGEIESDAVHIPVDVQFQPIAVDDVASHLAPYIIAADYTGRLPEFGGAEVLHLEQLAAEWLQVQGKNPRILPSTETDNDLPFFNNFGDGFVKGYNTNPENAVEGLSWRDYLRECYGEIVK